VQDFHRGAGRLGSLQRHEGAMLSDLTHSTAGAFCKAVYQATQASFLGGTQRMFMVRRLWRRTTWRLRPVGAEGGRLPQLEFP
jgi:hypothetical protein